MDSINKSSKIYLIDHQEGGLLDWSTSEYIQIMKYLNSSQSKIVISNASTFTDETDADDKLKDKIKICNENLFNHIIIHNEHKDKFFQIKEGINDIVTIENGTKFLNLPISKFESKRVCLLDLRGEKELSPEDSQEFDVFIFGGILGDNPPREYKTTYLRNENFPSRHLGSIQMSTDTAVLTTKLIIENGIKMQDIPFIVEPEFYKNGEKKGNKMEECVCMEGFRYISNEMDYNTGVIIKNDSPKPLGHDKIYGELIFEEFDFSQLI
jgi:ribosome biogenesis SPOUT family RNA methylase Rps3